MGKSDNLSISLPKGGINHTIEPSPLPGAKSSRPNIKDCDPLIKGDLDEYLSSSAKPFTRKVTLNFSRVSRHFHGWRTGALISSFLAGFSLLINIAVAAWLGTRSVSSGLGVVSIFTGDCGTVQTMDLWVHLAINILSTLLLGGSNYCMQCLSAPTRMDVDAAHKKGKWLDVGVPSVRNLGAVPWYKTFLYNSAFYKSLATNDYDIFVVQQGFLDGGRFDTEGIVVQKGSLDPTIIQQGLTIPGRYERLENADCIKAYATDINSDRRNVVLVSTNSTPDITTLLHVEHYSFGLSVGPRGLYKPYGWICDDIDLPDDLAVKLGLTFTGYETPINVCDKLAPRIANEIANQWTFKTFPVAFCMSEIVPETCSYSGNVPIVSVVIICNAIKVGVMLFVALCLRDDPLITIGDAIESFLNHTDETTKGHCLDSKRDVIRNRRWGLDQRFDAKVCDFKTRKWRSAVSGRRWALVVGSLAFAIIVVSVLLTLAIKVIGQTAQSIWTIGLGKVNSAAIIRGWDLSTYGTETERIVKAILVANTPQAVFSFIYLQINGLLTSMWLSDEWKGFEFSRKTLRVSKPKGDQRSKHFLQLPYRAAIPMLVVGGLMHWLLSQSIFLAVVAEYRNDGELVNPTTVGTCGFSPLAIIFVIASCGCLMIGVIALGQRNFKGGMPLAGSCSAAISAACHPLDWDKDASMQPVQWGVVQDSFSNGGVGHCSITSAAVESVQQGEKYAGATHITI
ncbi:hypothetical protein LTR84_003832 [Exophiala bonariae]|uniref:DUF6536 domain-containing protein n=1 Tax=Exophiala bonariae TaxID=1690606 RepID=A0AAV9NAW7_9EURO|nr:hypothetical protein LTR84_003832 [Exophiala bonariae]